MVRTLSAWALLWSATSCSPSERAEEGRNTPEARAVAFLVREVPKWPEKNKCFSCHNNGDAARALYVAAAEGFDVPAEALDATSRWLAQPEKWDENGPEGEFSDRKLADLQFASALYQARVSGDGPQRGALGPASRKIRALQTQDGSIDIRPGTLAGSPVTYGRTLATVMGRNVLLLAEGSENERAAARAREWLRKRRPPGVFDAAALLLGLSREPEIRAHCIEVIRKGQTREGGWGPYVTSAPEPFDTAVVLLALAALPDRSEVSDLLRQGRAYLVGTQLTDGTWPETTRPAGEVSYAHRLSTTGWATLALLATRPTER